MKHIISLVSLLVLTVSQFPAMSAETPDAWKPFQYLIGDWVGVGSGKTGDSDGEFTLKFDLDQKVLVRRNRARLPASMKQPKGAVHEDLMIIYRQPGSGAFRADYYDNEGNVIHYTISMAENSAVFTSDEPVSATRFRLTYELKSDGVLQIDFAIATPGKTFQTCLSGTCRRK